MTLPRIGLACVFVFAAPALAQVTSTPGSMTPTPEDSVQMQLPPLVNGESYPAMVGDEIRANFLSASVLFEAAYDDNVLSGVATKPVSDTSYSIRPTLSLDQTTPRQHATLTYSPGFTFYQPTSALNEQDESVLGAYHYRLTEHATLGAQESFQKSSNVFNQADSYSGGPVTGTPGVADVVAPFADRDTNVTNGDFGYQFTRDQLVGASGVYTRLSYPNPKQAVGLYGSSAYGGSAFFAQRLTEKFYLGGLYQYLRSLALISGATLPSGAVGTSGSESETSTQAAIPYVSIYFRRRTSLTLAAGPQYVNASQTQPSLTSSSWAPMALAGFGLQGEHTSFSAAYSRTVAGGGGLLGAFDINRANALGRWQMARLWFAQINGTYSIEKSDAPSGFAASPGGHTASAMLSFEHPIGERMKVSFGYDRLHQSYSGIAVLSTNPDSNREFISISYGITRPLGR